MANSAVTIRTLAGASGGSSDGMSIRKNVVQANSFVPGDAVYVDSSGLYQKAIATSLTTGSSVGIVETADGSAFVLVIQGFIDLTTVTSSVSYTHLTLPTID